MRQGWERHKEYSNLPIKGSKEHLRETVKEVHTWIKKISTFWQYKARNHWNKPLSWGLSSFALCIHESTALRESVHQLVYLYYCSISISPPQAKHQLREISCVAAWINVLLTVTFTGSSTICILCLPITKHGHMFLSGKLEI